MAIHVLTALGGGLALLALLEAAREHWAAMFVWLGAALIVDGVDGPLARRFRVATLQPRWSGEVLDLVVDFLTYVFVPAYALVAGGLLPPALAPLVGVAVVVSGAIYFADRRMKADDHHFRGFPALWNVAAFYLFLLRPPHWLATVALVILVVMTFVPIRVLHPVRVERLRSLNLLLMALWAALALFAVLRSFEVGPVVTATLCAIGIYVVAFDAILRLWRSVRS